VRASDYLLIPLSRLVTKKPLRRLLSYVLSPLSAFLERGIERMAERTSGGAARLFVLYASYHLQRRWADAEPVARTLAARYETSAWMQFLLSRVLRARKKRWEEAVALEKALSLRSNIARWHLRLGNVHEAMGRWPEAADAYLEATRLKPYRELWQYRAGYALHRSKRHAEAEAAYDQAIAHDRKLNARRLGIGVFHERFGRWDDAIAAYGAQVERDPSNPELHFRLGRAYAECFRFDDAAPSYERAVPLAGFDPMWSSDLGFAYLKLSRYEEAAAAYERAASHDRHNRSLWLYRAGDALVLAGQHERACELFAQMFPRTRTWKRLRPRVRGSMSADLASVSDWTDTRALLDRGAALFDASKIEEAVDAYREAAIRIADHGDPLHFELGLALKKCGRPEEACQSFLRTRPRRLSNGRYDPTDAPGLGIHRSALFVECVETLPIDEHVILYESFHGRSAACNPLALFRALIDDPRFSGFTHVWSFNEVSQAPADLKGRRNVVIARRESDLYIRYLATAKYLINNTSFSTYFYRRDGQLYLNTWHGTPLKTLGRDVQDEFAGWRNIARDLLQTTHILSPNPHTTSRLLESNQIAHLYRGEVNETGYPRIDLTLGMPEESVRQLKKRLRLDPQRPVLLFAPTFRGTAKTASVDIGRTVHALKELRALGYQVLYRGHYFVEHELIGRRLSSLVVPESVDTNALLSVVDVLVTDYSSVAVDFLATGRPMLFYTYDLEEYAARRGLYVSPNELPGVLCRTHDELLAAARDALAAKRSPGHDHAMRDAQARFCPHDDGKSASRTVDAFFFGVSSGLPRQDDDPRTSILVFAGAFIPNGISSAFLSLMNEIDASKYAVTLIIEPGLIQAFDDRMKQFDRLPSHVRVLARAGRTPATLAELRVIKTFDSDNDLAGPEMWRRYDSAFAREIRRLFGCARFDVVINYDGYGHFWTSLFARFSASRRVMYQHNAMLNEWRTRFPSLEGTFREYRNYDLLVSVSRSTMAVNRTDLCAMFNLSHVDHVFCDNIVSGDTIVHRSRLPPDDEVVCAFAKGAGTLFVTMGRLSLEKDQAKLLHAFARLREHHPKSKLLVIGDGPLRGDLERTTRELGLVGSVLFAGQKANPFPFLRLADCFVFSSLYEGQGLVLLEALMLGLPVISTDFPSAHDVLGDEHGLIVSNDVEGLFHGMMKFMNGEIDPPRFDHVLYRKSAIRSFYDKAIHGRSEISSDKTLRAKSS
jgi:CDP-glycerol glycerophosphotransferase